MKKIDIAKLNRSNKDIWAMIQVGLETRNFALLEKNLKRLHSLQAYYLDLLNRQSQEIRELEGELKAEKAILDLMEKEWLIEVSKRTGTYQNLINRIEETFTT